MLKLLIFFFTSLGVIASVTDVYTNPSSVFYEEDLTVLDYIKHIEDISSFNKYCGESLNYTLRKNYYVSKGISSEGTKIVPYEGCTLNIGVTKWSLTTN